MTISPLLVPVVDVQRLLRVPEDADDPYALLIVGQASNAVRDAAVRLGMTTAVNWVSLETSDVLVPPQLERPETASDVALWVASRAYTNPRNLERRTSGPISETFRDSGVYGTDLTDDEKDRLGGIPGATRGSGVWTLPMTYGGRPPPEIVVPVDYAVTLPDAMGFYIADEDQFPYAEPLVDPVILNPPPTGGPIVKVSP